MDAEFEERMKVEPIETNVLPVKKRPSHALVSVSSYDFEIIKRSDQAKDAYWCMGTMMIDHEIEHPFSDAMIPITLCRTPELKDDSKNTKPDNKEEQNP